MAILFRTREESPRSTNEPLEDLRDFRLRIYKGLGFFDADEVKDVMAMLWYCASASDLRAAAWLRSRFIRMSDEGLKRLGPRLADAIAAPTTPAVALDADDVEVLRLARESGARLARAG